MGVGRFVSLDGKEYSIHKEVEGESEDSDCRSQYLLEGKRRNRTVVYVGQVRTEIVNIQRVCPCLFPRH